MAKGKGNPYIKGINKIANNIDQNLFGNSPDFVDKNNKDYEYLRKVMQDINEKYRSATGTSMIEFFTKLNSDDDKKSSKKDISAEGIRNFREILNSTNDGLVDQLYGNEHERVKNYREYETMCKLIPLVDQVADIIADNIIAPDDVTKSIFDISYDKQQHSEIQSVQEIIDNLQSLESTYKIEPKSKKIVKQTLILGDFFLSVLPLKDEFTNVMQESANPVLLESVMINESEILISEEEINELNSITNTDTKKENVNWKKEIARIINENIEISNSPLMIMENDYKILKEEAINSGMGSYDKFKPIMSTDGADNVTRKGGNSIRRRRMKKKNTQFKVEGSSVRELNPEKMVVLSIGGNNLGYYYIDTPSSELQNQNGLNRFGNLQFSQQAELPSPGASYQRDPKLELISKIFGRQLASKIDDNFLKDNIKFKNIMYDLLRDKYVLDKKIRITYLAPDEVIHFKVNPKQNGYGTSILEPIMFTAKLYLASLITTLMLKITRSADHRTFYVETGLSKDVSGTIQGFIRDMKAKEVTMDNLQSVDSIFQTVGAANDYFIPQVNGEKAVDFDTIAGQDVSLDSDILEFLRKAIVSGLGVPSALLQMGDEVEFSRTLAMQNSRFLRNVINRQKEFSDPITELYRILYRNEYGERETVIDYKLVDVKLPAPIVLQSSMLNDNIGLASSIVEFLQPIITGSEAEQSEQDFVKKLLTKKYLPMINWEAIEEEVNYAKINLLKDNLLKADDSGSDDSGSDESNY